MGRLIEPKNQHLAEVFQLIAIALASLALAGCDEPNGTDADADGDTDVSTDGDGDADDVEDADGDADAETVEDADLDEDPDADEDVATPVAIGVNLSRVGAWSQEFVDMARASQAFQAIGGGDVPVDGHGWPTTDAMTVVFDVRPFSAWTGTIDDPARFTPDMEGTYLVSFTGEASVDETESDAVTVENVVYDSGSNRTTCDLVVPAAADEWNNVALLEFTGTSGGIRDLRITRPGYSHDTTQVFNEPFLDAARYASFDAIGFVNWLRPSDSNPDHPARREWSSRASVDDASWAGNGSGNEQGVPWEIVIALANELDRDIWINVPVAASDDYVTELATLLETSLDPGVNLYVEYSSEVWRPGQTQHVWNNTEATAAGLSPIESYAERSVEISRLFAGVFGASAINDRVRVVLAWNLSDERPDHAYREGLEHIRDLFGPPGDDLYGLAGGAFTYAVSAPADATVDDLLALLTERSDARVANMTLVRLVADDFALPGGVLAYRGGPELGTGDPATVENSILAARSEGMRDFIIHDLEDNWFGGGGGLFMFSVLCAPYYRHRAHGLTDDIRDPDRNHQFEALRGLLGDL